MAKTVKPTDRAENGSNPTQEEFLEKQAQALVDAGELSEEAPTETLREKVQDTFDYYPDEEFLWVVDNEGSISAFLSKDLVDAKNYAKTAQRKIVKINR
jgi:hypothetical protein